MRIGLIRHGETAWNAQGLLQGVSDIPLNPLGRSQAVSAGRMLRGQGWDLILSSPLVRARETAGILAAEAGLPEPGILEGVTERGFGELEGTSYWREDGTRAPLDHPSVEPISSVVERSVRTVRELAAERPDANVLVVAHGTVIRNILDQFMDEDAPGIANLALSVLVPGLEREFEVVIANGYPRFPLDEVHAVKDAPSPAGGRHRAETPDAQEPVAEAAASEAAASEPAAESRTRGA